MPAVSIPPRSSSALIALLSRVACCYVHLRGRARLRFSRQLLDHSGIFAPYNVLMYAFSAVPAKPILDRPQFPHLDPLRDGWRTIREEALHLFDEGYIRAAEKHNDASFDSFFKEGWKRFYLKWYGEPLPSAQALCPNTVALLETIPSVKAAMFALLPPGSKLNPHRDPFAGSLRYHLGLDHAELRRLPDLRRRRAVFLARRRGHRVRRDVRALGREQDRPDARDPVLRRRASAAHAGRCARSTASSAACSARRPRRRTSRPSASARSTGCMRFAHRVGERKKAFKRRHPLGYKLATVCADPARARLADAALADVTAGRRDRDPGDRRSVRRAWPRRDDDRA